MEVTFWQMLLQRVFTLPDYRSCRELSIDVLYVTRASICVELWTNEGSYRILVPMSYISWLDIGGHWKEIIRKLMIVESILQLTNSSESDQRSFRKRRWGRGLPLPGGRTPAPASENFFDPIRLNSPIEGWIRRPTAHGRRIHRITNHI